MDLAYDHIQEEAYPKDGKEFDETPKSAVEDTSLNNDLQDAYKAISSSAWGMRIGGFLGNVMKQARSPLPNNPNRQKRKRKKREKSKNRGCSVGQK